MIARKEAFSNNREINSREFASELYQSETPLENVSSGEQLTLHGETGKSINKTIQNSSFDAIELREASIKYLRLKGCRINCLTIFCAQSPNIIILEDCYIIELIVAPSIPTGKERLSEFSALYCEISRLTIDVWSRTIKLIGGIYGDVNVTRGESEKEVESRIEVEAIKMNLFEVKESKNVFLKIYKVTGGAFHLNELDEAIIMLSSTESTQFTLERCEGVNMILDKNKSVSLNILQTHLKHVSFQNDTIKTFYITGSCLVQETYTNPWNKTECEKLILQRATFSEATKFHLSSFSFKDIVIEHFENNGSFQIKECELGDKMLVNNSILGKTGLINCELSVHQKLLLIDSSIDNVEFVNFRWRNDFLLEEEAPKEIYQSQGDYLFSLRESYRRLKSNYIANGNKIEALEFQKHELRIHYQIARAQAIKSIVTRHQIGKYLGNFLILYTHKHVSDFSQNVWKPLLLLFAFHFVLFNIMIHFYDLGYYWSSNPSLDATTKAISDYFITLLPTHGSELKKFASPNFSVDITGLTDIAMRIFAGYFIFYFISASRKYHQ